MDFTFEADPNLDVALGIEGTGEVEVYETENGIEEWDLSSYDPNAPTEAKPGSEDKVKMLSARYAAGLPLWDPSDCYDHGPGQIEALLGDDSEMAEFEDVEEEKKVS